MKQSEQSCGNCDAFRPIKNAAVGLGTCRASIPGVMQGMSQRSVISGQVEPVLQGVWPPTRVDEWCRQWQRAEQESIQ